MFQKEDRPSRIGISDVRKRRSWNNCVFKVAIAVLMRRTALHGIKYRGLKNYVRLLDWIYVAKKFYRGLSEMWSIFHIMVDMLVRAHVLLVFIQIYMLYVLLSVPDKPMTSHHIFSRWLVRFMDLIRDNHNTVLMYDGLILNNATYSTAITKM